MDDQVVDAGGQQTPVWNAGLNGVHGGVARRRIAEQEFSREIGPEPRRCVVRPDISDALFCPQQPVTLQPAEAPTVEENPAIQIPLRVERQAKRFGLGTSWEGNSRGGGRFETAESAEMVHVVIGYLRAQANRDQTRPAPQSRQ